MEAFTVFSSLFRKRLIQFNLTFSNKPLLSVDACFYLFNLNLPQARS